VKTIYVIVSLFQGVYDGIDFAGLESGEAQARYRALVRTALGPRAKDWSWAAVEAAYENDLEHGGLTEQYYLDQIRVEV